MQEYKNTKKKIYIISFVLVLMLSVGLYFAFSSYDRKANADFPVQCIHTVFSQNKVQGSGFYTFLRDSGALFTAAGATVGLIFGHPIIGAGIGTFVKYGLESLSEVINDDNGEYYSYFFYLDGTTNKAHLSFNGADDYYDDSPASVNFLEDVVDEIKGVFDGIGSTPFMIGLKIVLGLVVLVICVGLVVKVYHLIFSKKRKR